MSRTSIAGAVLTGLLVAGVSACAPLDDAGATRPASRDAAGESPHEVRPVTLPDLSRLPDSVRAQVRERHTALTRIDRPEAPADELGRAHGDLGHILMAAGYETAALSSLRNAQAVAPHDPRWPYYLAQFHNYRSEHARATALFERALELRPADVPTLVHLARLYVDQGRLDDAQGLFQQALDHDPRSAVALAGRGHVALARGDHAQAVELLTRALTLEPEATSLHYPLAMAYRGLGEPHNTDAHLQQRGDGKPTLSDPLMTEYDRLLESGRAYERRGWAAYQAGRWAEAAALFHKGLELEPESLALRHPRALALARMGETDAAVEELEAIVRRSPTDGLAHYSLGVIFVGRERAEEAASRFALAVRHNSNHLEAHMGLALSLEALGRPEDSLEPYRRVVELDPRRVDAWIERANVLIGLERYQEALDWLMAARRIHVDQPELTALHDVVEAVLNLQKALGRVSGDRDAPEPARARAPAQADPPPP